MKRCCCLVFVFLSFLAFFAAPKAAFPGDSEKDALLEKLLQARENWLQNASFCKIFTAKSGSFSSEEKVLTDDDYNPDEMSEAVRNREGGAK